MKKFLIGCLTASMVLGSSTFVFANESEGKGNRIETITNVEIPSDKARVSGCHSPSTAYYLDPSLYGYFLNDTANSLENWYYFKTNPTDELSIYLEAPSSGDYDIYLYRYYEDGTIVPVDYSENAGGDEYINYVGDEDHTGFYWLRVVPYIASDIPGDKYSFGVDVKNETVVEPLDLNGVYIKNLSVTGDMGACDYGYGRMVRAEHKLNVSGTLVDKNGNPIASDLLRVYFKNPSTYQNSTNPVTVNVSTGADGKFNITVPLAHASGVYTYPGYTTHYYDIAGYTIFMQGASDAIATNTIYHYAYSLY